MKLKTLLYKRAVEIGIEADPRGKKRIEKMLKKHAGPPEEAGRQWRSATFDEERTWNPFGDCARAERFGRGGGEVRLMVGVDIEVGEAAPGRPPAREGREDRLLS
jgi:hypothetical protein